MTKLNQESGRSMVEMLGVLAIIGVLSIGGIAGYTMAMNRYKANEILAAAAQIAIIGETAQGGEGGDASLADLGISVKGASGIAYDKETKSVTISGVDSGVETAINSIIGNSACTSGTCGLAMSNGRLVAS